MTKTFSRLLFALAGATLLATVAFPATAATLTYNDPSCAGFQITGSGGSFTLTCAKLQCSITGLTNPTTAQNTALMANCTPAGTSYLWSLVAGPFSDVSCNAPSAPTANPSNIVRPNGIAAGQTRSCLYQVNATAAPLSGQAMVTVTWSDTAAVPPTCNPSAVTVPSPMTSAGGSITLNANCVPSAGVTYTWTRTAPAAGAPTSPTSATPTDTMAANASASAVAYTWQVIACTSPTTCNTKTISSSVPGTGGGGGGVSCAGFGKTAYIDLGWPDYSSLHTQDVGGLNGNDALVIRIAPPAGALSPSGTAGSLNLQEYAGPTANRYAVLSTNSCDFVGNAGYLDNNAIPILFSGSTAVGLNSIQVNRQDYPSQIKLLPGTVYYLNLKSTHADGVTPSCGTGGCNMILNWIKPPGT